MIRTNGSQRLAMSPLEEDVVRAVVTKFASDLTLFRLSSDRQTRESAALEELATSAAVKLAEDEPVTVVESVAVVAILETVCADAPDEFFDAICADELAPLSCAQMRCILECVNRRLATGDYTAAA